MELRGYYYVHRSVEWILLFANCSSRLRYRENPIIGN
jgi:hypothetical protein